MQRRETSQAWVQVYYIYIYIFVSYDENLHGSGRGGCMEAFGILYAGSCFFLCI
jgi:hypothetical protein